MGRLGNGPSAGKRLSVRSNALAPSCQPADWVPNRPIIMVSGLLARIRISWWMTCTLILESARSNITIFTLTTAKVANSNMCHDKEDCLAENANRKALRLAPKPHRTISAHRRPAPLPVVISREVVSLMHATSEDEHYAQGRAYSCASRRRSSTISLSTGIPPLTIHCCFPKVFQFSLENRGPVGSIGPAAQIFAAYSSV